MTVSLQSLLQVAGCLPWQPIGAYTTGHTLSRQVLTFRCKHSGFFLWYHFIPMWAWVVFHPPFLSTNKSTDGKLVIWDSNGEESQSRIHFRGSKRESRALGPDKLHEKIMKFCGAKKTQFVRWFLRVRFETYCRWKKSQTNHLGCINQNPVNNGEKLTNLNWCRMSCINSTRPIYQTDSLPAYSNSCGIKTSNPWKFMTSPRDDRFLMFLWGIPKNNFLIPRCGDHFTNNTNKYQLSRVIKHSPIFKNEAPLQCRKCPKMLNLLRPPGSPT